jgi:hypothetical protein
LQVQIEGAVAPVSAIVQPFENRNACSADFSQSSSSHGFVAGLVVTGRMRTAADSRAASATPDQQQAQRLPGAVATTSTGSTGDPTSPASPVGRPALPTSRRCDRGRRSPLVRSFFRYAGDDDVFGVRERHR